MPTLAIYTNVHKSYVPDDFLTEASKMFQQAIGKPMEVRQIIQLNALEECLNSSVFKYMQHTFADFFLIQVTCTDLRYLFFFS